VKVRGVEVRTFARAYVAEVRREESNGEQRGEVRVDSEVLVT
jgi:hypothetical protein